MLNATEKSIATKSGADAYVKCGGVTLYVKSDGKVVAASATNVLGTQEAPSFAHGAISTTRNTLIAL